MIHGISEGPSRRIGGLETSAKQLIATDVPSRRIGGLEIGDAFSVQLSHPSRRIGGLEIDADISPAWHSPSPPDRRLRDPVS